MNSRKMPIDPLARRKTATKNIELRRNIMLRDEPVTGAEDFGSGQENPKMDRSKRRPSTDASPFYTKKALRNDIPKITEKQQENRFLHDLPYSDYHPKISVDEEKTYDTSLNSDESYSILDNNSKTESTKSVIENNDAHSEAHLHVAITDANSTDRPEAKLHIETLFIDGGMSTILQKENDEERATIPKTNDGIETSSPIFIDTKSADKPVQEQVDMRFFESDVYNNVVLQEKTQLETSAKRNVHESEIETSACNDTADVNSMDNLPMGNDVSVEQETGITLRNLETVLKKCMHKDSIEGFSLNVAGLRSTENPGKDSDETRSLGSENDTTLQNETSQEITVGQPKKQDQNDTFLDGDTIRNDLNLNQESLDLITESDLGIDLNYVHINDNADELVQYGNIKNSSIAENAGTSSSIQKNDYNLKRKLKRAAVLFKNSCIDFTSGNEDYSPGSSDVWSPCESEISETSESKKKKVIKQKKKSNEKSKQKEKYEEISRKKVYRTNKRKIQKESKRSGKSYEGRGGKRMEEKSMKANPCVSGICARECYNISDDRRKGIFDYYWSLDYQRQRDWIVMHSKITDVKRKKTKQNISRRKKTIEYFINEGEGLRKVCQKFLMNTLDVSQKLLQYTTENQVEGFALEDQRTYNGVIKYSEESKNFAREFIDKLPAVSSHYCRRQSQKLYLPQNFKNISNLYRLYSENCKVEAIERVSEVIFRKIFNEEYNLSFHVPKKDKCVQCIKSENGQILTTTEQENLKLHIEEKKASYHRFKIHQNLQCVDTVTTSFDLQKVLNTPYGESMLLYYSRKYSMFNLTFYESQTQNGFCYLWGESDAKRGSNEVATCITKYLKDVDMRKKKNVLLYCDSCSGQNKNKVVISALHHFLMTSKHIQVIQINFLLPGHSYMPVDSMHAVIEREVKRLIVWSPSQWPTFIEAARKNPFPYKIETIEYSDIIDWNDLAAKAFRGDPIKDLRKVRVITLKKKNLKNIEIKYSMKDNAETQKTEIFKNPPTRKGKGKGKNKTKISKADEIDEYENVQLLPLYTKQIELSEAKYNDLRKLCNNGTIPKRYHKEYLSLPTSKNTRGKLPETDEEEEIENMDDINID